MTYTGIFRYESVFLTPPVAMTIGEPVGNDEVVRRVRERFDGDDRDFRAVQRGLARSFGSCGTEVRYLDPEGNGKIALSAAEAGRRCLDAAGLPGDAVDVLIYGGITRAFYEPATAAEVAARLGLERVAAFDVTCACCGFLQALDAAATYLSAHPALETVLCCTAEVPNNQIGYDIATLLELQTRSAALTLGSGAAACLVTRHRLAGASFRLHSTRTQTAPAHWRTCVAPQDGSLTSDSVKLFEIAKIEVPRAIREHVAEAGWPLESLRQVISHQPGDHFLEVLGQLAGVAPEAWLAIHGRYGNVATASVALALQDYLEASPPTSGDRFLLMVPGGGFSVVTAAVEWLEAGPAAGSASGRS